MSGQSGEILVDKAFQTRSIAWFRGPGAGEIVVCRQNDPHPSADEQDNCRNSLRIAISSLIRVLWFSDIKP
jgi:hypothetical protein